MKGYICYFCSIHTRISFLCPLPQLPDVLDKVWGNFQTGESCFPEAKSLRTIFKEQRTLPLNISYWHLSSIFSFWTILIMAILVYFFLDPYHQISFSQTEWAQSVREEMTITSGLDRGLVWQTARKTGSRLLVLPLRNGCFWDYATKLLAGILCLTIGLSLLYSAQLWIIINRGKRGLRSF